VCPLHDSCCFQDSDVNDCRDTAAQLASDKGCSPSPGRYFCNPCSTCSIVESTVAIQPVGSGAVPVEYRTWLQNEVNSKRRVAKDYLTRFYNATPRGGGQFCDYSLCQGLQNCIFDPACKPGYLQFACSTELLPRTNYTAVQLSFIDSKEYAKGRLYALKCTGAGMGVLPYPPEVQLGLFSVADASSYVTLNCTTGRRNCTYDPVDALRRYRLATGTRPTLFSLRMEHACLCPRKAAIALPAHIVRARTTLDLAASWWWQRASSLFLASSTT
jgi:hypothetical protein